MATPFHSKSKSVIICSECNSICHEDLVNSILSDVETSECVIFNDYPNKCFVCNHGKIYHSRSIHPAIIKKIFTDAKVNGDVNDIISRIKYLGNGCNNKQNKQIINMLQKDKCDAPYIWMYILWKSQNYTTPQQKLDFIKKLESAFDADYSLTNSKGWNIIHILCNNNIIIDDKTSELLLNYLITESKKCNDRILSAQCHIKRTPLHYAAECGKLRCIKQLIDKYGNMNILSLKDANHQNIIDIAIEQKHVDIIKYLTEYMSDNNHNGSDEKKQELYHEKQEWEMCLLHAINSLLQKPEFTSKSLDKICKELAPDKLINPHKSILQTGNYDANVLIMALNKTNIDVQWFDARKVNELDLNNKNFLEPDKKFKFIGFILNNPQKTMFKIFNRRHWLTIKQIDNIWYNLDSKLKQPIKYKNANDVNIYLKNALKNNNAELMVCRRAKKQIINK